MSCLERELCNSSGSSDLVVPLLCQHSLVDISLCVLQHYGRDHEGVAVENEEFHCLGEFW